jgi:hypothetical protein
MLSTRGSVPLVSRPVPEPARPASTRSGAPRRDRVVRRAMPGRRRR